MKELNEVFIIFDKSVYFYSVEQNCIQLFKKHILVRFLNKVLTHFKIFYPYLIIQNKSTIQNARKIIITDTAYSLRLHDYIVKLNSNADIYLYYMNTIDIQNEYKMKEKFIERNVYSFDYKDCNKYKMKFLHTPYSSKLEYPLNDECYDVIFLGRSKGREQVLVTLQTMLNRIGSNFKFMVLDSDDPSMKIDNYISYKQYLFEISKSKCILEIIKDGQSGSTLRALEALWFKKKLITNNKNIVYDGYYDKENTFIIDEGNFDEEELSDFLNKAYVETEINRSDIEFQNWLSNFGD